MPNDLTIAQMRAALMRNDLYLQSIGANEAPSLPMKAYLPPDREMGRFVPPGGAPIQVGGADMSARSGRQLQPTPPQPPQPPAPPGQPPQGPQGGPPGLPDTGMPQPGQPGQGGPNFGPSQGILQMTPQGQSMAALRPTQQPKNMADGGTARPKFAIAPPSQAPKAPTDFTPYDADNPSMKGLATAFDEAIAYHLSLSPEQRQSNSAEASRRVGDIIGRTSTGQTKDLLGKNAKLMKSEAGEDEAISLPDGRGVETTGLALAPAYQKGKFQTCPNHASCKKECLGKTSGNYFKLGGGQDLDEFKGPRLNSLLKTNAFIEDPHAFAVKLHDEIMAAKSMAAENGNHLGVRLNVLSDINPRVHKSIIEAHPDVTFYDYTKNNTDPIASNHHYTYSSTGASQPGVDNPNTNWKQMRRRLDQGDNVAMAFSHKEHLPEIVHDQETGKRYRVVNGDTHDFRPLDIQPDGTNGVIIGLKNKKATGKVEDAHKDSSGFFVHYDPQLKKTEKGTYERAESDRISPTTGKPMLGATIPQNRVVNIMPQQRKMIQLNNDGEEQK